MLLNIDLDWYQIHKINEDSYMVKEPEHVAFFIVFENEHPYFIDTGMGVSKKSKQQLFNYLNISNFSVLSTHTHCDHVGLNHLACKVYVDKEEYKKYEAHNDSKQIIGYHKDVDSLMDWPEDLLIKQVPCWKEKVNIDIDDIPDRFETIKTPGHTIGHRCYFDKKTKNLYVGDLIYDGEIYLNFPDSDLNTYIKSLEIIMLYLDKVERVLPSHNSIPLDPQYIRNYYNFLVNVNKDTKKVEFEEMNILPAAIKIFKNKRDYKTLLKHCEAVLSKE